LAFVDLVHELAVPGVRGVMIGDGPLLRDVEESAARLGLCAKEFSAVGSLPAAARYMSAFDVLVMTSRIEGTPMVLLEAMAAGVPIATYAVGGIPMVVDSSMAYLAEPANLAQLIDVTRSALDDPGDARNRVYQARAAIDMRFSPGAWLERIEAVYDEILGRIPPNVEPGGVTESR